MNWISVEDRLPKNLQKVLFHWIFNGHCKNISMGYFHDGGWDIYLPYQSHGLVNDKSDIVLVTHWAELPSFPKPTIELFGNEVQNAIHKEIMDKIYARLDILEDLYNNNED